MIVFCEIMIWLSYNQLFYINFYFYRVFVINFMIPGPPYYSFVVYLEGDKVPTFNYFWK